MHSYLALLTPQGMDHTFGSPSALPRASAIKKGKRGGGKGGGGGGARTKPNPRFAVRPGSSGSSGAAGLIE